MLVCGDFNSVPGRCSSVMFYYMIIGRNLVASIFIHVKCFNSFSFWNMQCSSCPPCYGQGWSTSSRFSRRPSWDSSSYCQTNASAAIGITSLKCWRVAFFYAYAWFCHIFLHCIIQVSAYSSFARAGVGLGLEQRRRIDPASNEPLFTNCTRDFIGTHDYIFYSGKLELISVLLEHCSAACDFHICFACRCTLLPAKRKIKIDNNKLIITLIINLITILVPDCTL